MTACISKPSMPAALDSQHYIEKELMTQTVNYVEERDWKEEVLRTVLAEVHISICQEL